MKSLNISTDQTEYVRVMEKRIRYYAEKYDPHTLIYQQEKAEEPFVSAKQVRKRGPSRIRTIFLNFF